MEQFWKPQPTPPESDWIAPWLKWSLRVSTVGWVIYGVFALAFDDIAVIPVGVQSWLVILGSALIVAGAEMNTGPTVVAVARKWGRGRAQPLDTVAFVVSLVGSITAGLIAFSIRQTRLGGSGWRAFALDWGPLVVGIAIACDFYAAGIELGLVQSDYESDMERWLEERRAYNEQHHITEPVTLTDATIDDARYVVARMNGERATLTADELANALAVEKQKRFPSASTGSRWARLARNGKLLEAN